MEREYSEQVSAWRDQMETKAKELEELQHLKLLEPSREMDLLKLKVAEEVEQPYVEKVEQLELKLELDQRKLNDNKRQLEVVKLEMQQKVQELHQSEKDTIKRLDVQKEIFQKKINSFQEDLEKNNSLGKTVNELRQQVYERAQKHKAVLEEMESMENRYKTEVDSLRAELTKKSSEVLIEKKQDKSARQAEAENEDGKRRLEDLTLKNYKIETELERVRTDARTFQTKADLKDDVEKSKLELVAKCKAQEQELESLKKNLEAKNEALTAATNRAETLARENHSLNQDSDQRVADAEIALSAEKETSQTTITGLRSELEHVRTQLKDKETGSNAQLQSYESKIEALTMDLLNFKDSANSEEKRAKEMEQRCLDYGVVSKDYQELQQKYRENLSISEDLRKSLNGVQQENATLVATSRQINRGWK